MKLHPCPKCKTAKHLIVDTSTGNSYRQVYCNGCGAFGPLAFTAKQARTMWNDRRTIEDLVQPEKEGTP